MDIDVEQMLIGAGGTQECKSSASSASRLFVGAQSALLLWLCDYTLNGTF